MPVPGSAFLFAATSRQVGIDIFFTDKERAQYRWEDKGSCGEEDRAIPQEVTDHSDQAGSKQVAGGIESLVSAKLPIKGRHTDNAHGDRRQRWPKKRPGSANQDLRRIDDGRCGGHGEQQRPPYQGRESQQSGAAACEQCDQLPNRQVSAEGQ